MEWEGRRESDNVEDGRSGGKTGAIALGGGGIIIALIALFFGVDLNKIGLGNLGQQGGEVQQEKLDPEEERLVKFVKVVLADTEDVWNAEFRKMNKRYQEPKLRLFSNGVDSACGFADSAVGPFYCPGDDKVYLDLAFFKTLKGQLRSPGDFAQAYVIAHEVGHHVQNLLGTSARVETEKRRLSKAEANQLSVRLELQADFYAGIFAHYAKETKKVLQPGDLEEALRAANAIGDDTLQRNSGRGRIVPDSFTHGTSEQRVRWFRLGLTTGDVRKGDTFGVNYRDL